MKKFYSWSVLTGFLAMFFSFHSNAQVINGGAPGNFGLDGELWSGQHQFGTNMPLVATASHDWFKGAASTSMGVIDTTGSAALKQQLMNNQNINFSKGASFPKFTVQNGYLMLDAMYARDRIGQNANTADNTIFKTGAQNGQDPTSWKSDSGPCQDKSDIIDVFVHMRRNGTVVNNTNPSHLILYMAASTLDNYGYLDFELYRSALSVNSTTGKFENAGPDGGHHAWKFNSDGSINQTGDMLIGFDVAPGAVNNISVNIWVSMATFQTVNPAKFDFVPGEFHGNTGYGYAKLKANPGEVLQQWAVVNTSAVTAAAPWGTSSKDLGGSQGNSFSTNYSAGQFSEVALDLTSFGIDPAFNANNSNCQPAFQKILIKTSSSNQWTSALKDYAGPFNFLNAVPSAEAPTPAKISCAEPRRVLQPNNVVPGASYNWTTSDGHFYSRADTATPVVDKKGYYTLTVTPLGGCGAQDVSTIRLKADFDPPVATAPPVRYISQLQPVTYLNGGDTLASNFPTEFGGSSGLGWKWTGPNNYSSTIQSPPTSNLGNYQLIATELRNGCKDTAVTSVQWMAVLPVRIINFAAALVNKNTVDIKWITVGEEGGERYEIERSTDGINFTKVYAIDGFKNATMNVYSNKNDITGIGAPTVYYRVKSYAHDALYTITNVVRINLKAENENSSILSVTPSVNRGNAVLNFFTPNAGEMQVFVYDIDGKMLFQAKGRADVGINNVQLPINNPGGTIKMKIVRLDLKNEVLEKKFLF